MTQPNIPNLPFYEALGDGPWAIAHQGADFFGAHRENTMPAFEAAVAAGYTYIESDTVATKDNVALAAHGAKNARNAAKLAEERRSADPNAESFWPLRRDIESRTYDEVMADPAFLIGGEPMPRLDELLGSFPDVQFMIDAKTSHSVLPLAKVIDDLDAHDRVSVGSFSSRRTQDVVDALGSRGRHIARSAGMAGAVLLMATRHAGPAKDAMASLMRRSAATQFSVPHKLSLPGGGERVVVDSEMVELAHELGKRITPWTPNSHTDIERMYAAGVDGVISDLGVVNLELAAAYRRI